MCFTEMTRCTVDPEDYWRSMAKPSDIPTHLIRLIRYRRPPPDHLPHRALPGWGREVFA